MAIEFIKILNPWGESHGGNQGNFGNQPNGKRIKRCGCGLMAVCDMTLFLQKANVIPWVEYVKFVCEKAKKLNISDSFGLPTKKVVNMLSEANADYSFTFIPKRKLSENKLRESFEKSISAGFPVIVRVGENLRRLPYKMNGSERKMRWHYFTVIGIENDKLTFCSWGKKGEMLCSDLYRYFGFTGGIIITKN